ncbi:MAG: LemA family protein [Limnohabitans sp.]|nr:LemA family protein [Limnohabitans sp.]
MDGIPLLFANTALFVVLGVVLTALLIPVLWVIAVYNGLRRSQVRAKNAFSQIDVQLKRRFDLIPNLVETVKGYMAHERATLEAVIAARSQAAGALGAAQGAMLGVSAVTQLANASTALDGALGRLVGLVERYPELKANQNALQLQEELASTENRIAFARQAYNDAVMRLNEQIVVFPASIVARTFGVTEMGLFEADAAARAAVAVKF